MCRFFKYSSTISLQLLFFLLCQLFSSQPVSVNLTKKCDVCKDIARRFNEGLQKTSASNFGGGNTNWEENYLGSYDSSETRLIEIMEQCCESDKRECHQLLEETEEAIEDWWALQEKENLQEFLCQNHLKVCCGEGRWGKECGECPGGRTHPCGGRGSCEGSGHREGSGVCSCSAGYSGHQCSRCSMGFYEEGGDGEDDDEDGEDDEEGGDDDDDDVSKKLTCSACPPSCLTSCQSSDSATCDECKIGWTREEGEGCVDVDECNTGVSNCSHNHYCLNTPGSHNCMKCDGSCEGCRGEGREACVHCAPRHFEEDSSCTACHPSCNNTCDSAEATSCDSCGQGWVQEGEDGCVDVDECLTQQHHCKETEHCNNTMGSFLCQSCQPPCLTCSSQQECLSCRPGFHLSKELACVDIDECQDTTACTDANEVCVNMRGGHTCECLEGYVRRQGSLCFKKNIPTKKKKGGRKEEEKMKDGKKKEMSEEELMNLKMKAKFEDVKNIVAGPDGFSREDIEKLGKPLDPEESTFTLEGGIDGGVGDGEVGESGDGDKRESKDEL